MDQHPVPRQITTFEFKLIGFMTLRQFIYVLAFVPVGYITYLAFPLPIVNIVIGFIVGSLGAVVAFLPVQDRSIDEWIKILSKRLNAPTQYFYHKKNLPLAYLSDLYFVNDPHKVYTHIESRSKLSQYLSSKKPVTQGGNKKQNMQSLLTKSTSQLSTQQPKSTPPAVPSASPDPAIPESASVALPAQSSNSVTVDKKEEKNGTSVTDITPPSVQQNILQLSTVAPPVSTEKKPTVLGVIKNNKKIPLPGILIYIKDNQKKPIRLLKTNPHGVFASYNPLAPGTYSLEVKDPRESYFFDTMNITVENDKPVTLQINSKEML